MCTSTVGNDLGLTDKNHACSCSTDSGAAPLDLVPQGSVRELYLVEGMTCEHCVSSVTGALQGLDTRRGNLADHCRQFGPRDEELGEDSGDRGRLLSGHRIATAFGVAKGAVGSL
jgi:hypothetical protein